MSCTYRVELHGITWDTKVDGEVLDPTAQGLPHWTVLNVTADNESEAVDNAVDETTERFGFCITGVDSHHALALTGPEASQVSDPYIADELRGDIAMDLREKGFPTLADWVDAFSDEAAEEIYENAVKQAADGLIKQLGGFTDDPGKESHA